MGFYVWRDLGWLITNKDGMSAAFFEDCGLVEVKLKQRGESESATCSECGKIVLDD